MSDSQPETPPSPSLRNETEEMLRKIDVSIDELTRKIEEGVSEILKESGRGLRDIGPWQMRCERAQNWLNSENCKSCIDKCNN